MLIFHGEKDSTVPLLQSQRLAAALKEKGATVELRVIAGAGHGFYKLGPEKVKELYRESIEFFKWTLHRAE